MREHLRFLDDAAARAATTCERALLNRLGGGCQVPIGAFAEMRNGKLHLESCVSPIPTGPKSCGTLATVTIPKNSATLPVKLCLLAAAMRYSKRFTDAAWPSRRNHEPQRPSQLLGGTKNSHALRRWINLWPPFLGAGIRVKRIAPDMKAVDVEMKLRWWNANYVGTHFGGSLFAMTDAFYMLMLMANLGGDYIVWDKAATSATASRDRARSAPNFV